MLRLFFKIDPDQLDDEKWAELTAEMWWALRATGKVEEKEGNFRFVN